MDTQTKALTLAQPQTMDVIRSLDDLLKLAGVLVKSGVLPQSIKSAEAAAAIILKGRELGIGAMEAFSGINVIQAKPTVSPQLMLALINRSGQLEDMQVGDDGTKATVIMKRRGRAAHTEVFSMDDALKLGLAGKDNWNKQPRTMRKWRAISACARVVFPDIVAGLYTPEEMGASVNEEGEVIDTEARVVSETQDEERVALPAPGSETEPEPRGSFGAGLQVKREPPPSQPQPEAKANGGNGQAHQRPYDLATLRKAIAAQAEKNRDAVPSPGKVGLLVGALNNIVGGDDKRHELLAALTPDNPTGSIKDVRTPYVEALLKWASGKPDIVRQEAESAIREFLQEHGQAEMEIA